MMKSIMLPILLVSLANFTLPGSVVAEPAYCSGRGPGPNSDGKEVSPFFFLGTAVAGIASNMRDEYFCGSCCLAKLPPSQKVLR
jgi:hypothetical protein